MLVICGLTEKIERRCREEDRSATTGSIVDAGEFLEFCLRTAERQTLEVRRTVRSVNYKNKK